jgi:hypothetical protein
MTTDGWARTGLPGLRLSFVVSTGEVKMDGSALLFGGAVSRGKLF